MNIEFTYRIFRVESLETENSKFLRQAQEILCSCELLQSPAGAALVASMGHLQREQGNLQGYHGIPWGSMGFLCQMCQQCFSTFQLGIPCISMLYFAAV